MSDRGTIWRPILGTASWLVALTCGLFVAACQADESTYRLIAGLRERRLFDQADFVVREALAELQSQEQTNSPDLVRLTIEQMQILTDRAYLAAPQHRAARWQAATKPAAEFLATHPDHPRGTLIELQQTLITMARIEALRGPSAITISPAAAREALELSQQARGQLLALQSAIGQQLTDARNGLGPAGGLTDVELSHLQRNLGYQLAICGLHRADLYSDDEALNRASAITEVIDQLQMLQRTTEVGEPLWWQTQLALVRAHRQAGDLDASQTLLERTSRQDLKSTRLSWTDDVLTEQVELVLAKGVNGTSIASANYLIRLADQVQPTPELDFACLRLLVALTQALPDDQRAPWVVRIQEQIERIGHQHGSWWQQQATRIPSSVAIEGHRETAAKQLKSILQSAQTSLETGDYQAAADGFETAAAIAKAQQLKDLRRSCVISGSQALEKLGHHDAAAKRQLTIANAQPNRRASASVHLRGCWNLGQADEPDDNQLTTALEQHLQTWPDSPTRATAEQWLANQQLKSGLREAAALTASNRHNQAVAILRTLATQHPEDSKVLLQLARSETQLALSPVGGSDESINRSLKRWRGIAKRLKPESDPWFEAKLSIAKLLHASESPQPARQLLDYLKALPGGWRESAFASEFDSLDRKIAP